MNIQNIVCCAACLTFAVGIANAQTATPATNNPPASASGSQGSPPIIVPLGHPISSYLFADSPKRQVELVAWKQADAARKVMKAGKTTEAFAVFLSLYQRGVAEVDLAYPIAVDGLARIYAMRGQFSESAAMYRKIVYRPEDQMWVSSFQGSVPTLMRFVLVLQRLGEQGEAMAVYQRAYDLYTTDAGKNPLPRCDRGSYNPRRLEAGALTVIGLDYINQNETDQAIAALRRVTFLQPDSGIAWSYLGEALRGKDAESQEAEDALRKAGRFLKDEIWVWSAKNQADGIAAWRTQQQEKRQAEARSPSAPTTPAP